MAASVQADRSAESGEALAANGCGALCAVGENDDESSIRCADRCPRGGHAHVVRAGEATGGATERSRCPARCLWVQPSDLATRDLYYGPWGRERVPDPKATYTFVELKHTGVNPGMTVRDPQGREWSVKQAYPGGMDFEGPAEVALSRLLSAVGYRQPPVYYLPTFTLKDDWGTHTEPGGRFRLDEKTLKSAGVMVVAGESFYRDEAVSRTARADDDVQRDRPEKQQQLTLRIQKRRPRRTVVRRP